MTSSRSIPNIFDASQASLFNSTASLDGNKSEISPSAIPNILALPAILPAVLSLPANVVALLGPNDFPGFPPGFGAAALGFKVVPSGLTPGFGVVPSGFGVASYFHPSHLRVDPDGGGAAGGAANVVLAIDPALAFTLKVRAGAEGAAALVPAVALASRAAGSPGAVGGTGVAVEVTIGGVHLLILLDTLGVEDVVLLGFIDFPDIPLDVTLDLIPGFPLDITSDLPLDFPPGLEALEAGAKGGVVEADAGVPVPGATGATGAGSAVGTPYFHPSHLEADPNFGAEGRAVNVPDVALAFTLGAEGSVVGSTAGALEVVPSHLKVDPGFGAEGRAVNILGVAPALGAALGALVALGEALAALSLSALYLAYLSAPYIVPAPTAVTAPAVPTTSPNALNGSTG